MKRSALISVAVLAMALASGCGDEEKSGTSCAAICKRIEAPDCENAAPDCIDACEDDKDSTPDVCQSKLDALSSCFASVKFQCDEDDYPEAQGCKRELDRWLDCRENHAFDDLDE